MKGRQRRWLRCTKNDQLRHRLWNHKNQTTGRNTMHKMKIAGLAVLMTAATAPYAAEIKPAVVFDIGGKFDKSFNEGVANGAERFKKETGIGYVGFETVNETQFEQAQRRFAQR